MPTIRRFLDALLLGVFLPDKVTFAINTHISERWWLKPFLGLSQVFRMDPTHPLSLKDLIHHLQKDSKTVIFPEGRLTETGSLMKIYDGPGLVAEKSGAKVLPIRFEGTQYSHFSKLRNIVRLRLFPKITMHILPPATIPEHRELTGKNRRKLSGHILADIMTDMMFKTSHYQQSIFSCLLEARAIHGGSHVIAEDLERNPVTYDQVVTRTLALSSLLNAMTQPGEYVGVMLPNSTKTLYVVLALQYLKRIPAMLNFSTGAAGMVSACQIAQVNTVLTSRKFIEMAKLELEAELLSQQTRLVYLEDLAASLSWQDKLKALCLAKTTDIWYDRDADKSDAPAVVLFTSGSEGLPKGVVLSHSNVLANHQQVAARISFTPQDVVLNYLPMFHSFGFTVATLLPVMAGMKVFFYPTPLHYAVIPEIAYEISATILFGTNTFFAAYAKKSTPV
ncbi:AMP-binding protein [Methylocucumis oryzae]|uniref:AMP-binding protein n=1 Tax=Methylocucumis oryzae TaxID=1632867 RepID=UPI000B20C08D